MTCCTFAPSSHQSHTFLLKEGSSLFVLPADVTRFKCVIIYRSIFSNYSFCVRLEVEEEECWQGGGARAEGEAEGVNNGEYR